MIRKHDTLAVSLLIFSGILTAWLGVFGPTNTTTWKDWQPLIAAVIALGGAGVVYRGAMLTYKAAMEKVELDRQIHLREIRRRRRGIILRVSHAVYMISEETDDFLVALRSPRIGQPPKHVDVFELKFRSLEGVDEAWANLDVFPADIAREFSRLKVAMLNFEEARNALGLNPIEFTSSYSTDQQMSRIRESALTVRNISKAIWEMLEIETVSVAAL
jgi:hypothetical protein